jgi:hypothetical protein
LMACHTYSVFKVLARVQGQKKKGLAIARPLE